MDLVVEMPTDAIDPLSAEFLPKDFYLPPKPVVLSEIEARGQFNLIHVGSGSKVDFIIRKDRDFSRTEFARRLRVPFSENVDTTSATPEDIILSKLQYYDSGRFEKHLEDIRGILRVSAGVLDIDYIDEWASKLNLADLWKDVTRD